MKLPFLSKKQEEKEFFLALLLSPGEIRSILFEKTVGGLLILGTYTQEFSEHLNTLIQEKLIELSDVVISEVEQKLPEGGSFEKVIFSVPYGWVSEGKIIKDHLAKLKILCEALKLSPIGFIVSIEAVIAYLHKKEGLPVTAVFVEVSQKHVTLSLVKNGTILNVFENEIDKNVLTTVEKLLGSQEDLEVLPSKIILLNYEHAKKIQQLFLSHTWAKNIKFLHIPQVEVLDTQVEAQAVISGVSMQMGFDSLPEINLSSINLQRKPVEIISEEREESGEEIAHIKEEVEDVQKQEAITEFSGESVGFFKEVDVLKEQAQEVHTEDVSSEEPETTENILVAKQKDNFSAIVPHFSKPTLPNIPLNLSSRFNLFSLPRGKFSFLYPIFAVVLFIALIVGYYYFFEKTQVILFLDKKNVNKELQVSFSSDKQTSVADSIVHVDTISVQESGKDTATATGKKETGDKAKGSVTLYSRLAQEKTLSSGTIITSSNSLVFTLDNDVKLASSSADASASPVAVKVNVTAKDIGKESNMPSGTKFVFASYDPTDLVAKNESAFSGGTKKEITVVSADDLSSLQTKVVNSLSQKSIQDQVTKKSNTSEILSLPLDYSFDQKSFSKKEGDEASSFSLSATITYTLGSYKKPDLVDLAKSLTQKDAPADYSYSGKDSGISVKDVTQDKNGIISGKLVFSSVFLPQVSLDTFPKEISGKSVDKASQLIQVKGITDDQILFVRSLPFFPKILPFNKNNIEIVTKTQ